MFNPAKSGPAYWALQALIWGNAAFYIAAFLTLLLECHPIKKEWVPAYRGGYCIDRNAVVIASVVINIVSDFLNLTLPLLAIWHLQMALKRKVAVSAVFATGLIYACIMSSHILCA